jgi:hypothetical protein
MSLKLIELLLTEKVGFEPTVSCPTQHFQCCAIDHSATSPEYNFCADFNAYLAYPRLLVTVN